ncbi:MAG: hypothetical protein JRJ87_10755 [Deltaproteobacteria bacterium]|nr:hypothetical protein [Deltaproteobacteria bacterium]
MSRFQNHWFLSSILVILVGVSGTRCGGGGSPEITQAFCEGLGLEFRETPDGQGYCYESGGGVDCATADDGTTCDDGDACTFSDVCASGVCVGTPLSGMDDGNPCTEDSCDPLNGEISHDATPLNGTSCDDADVCSSNDTCNNGVCTGDYTVDINGDPIDDSDDCTRDFCDAGGARQNEPYTAEEAALLGLGDITVEDVANPCMLYECVIGTGDTPHMSELDRTDCTDPDAGRTNGDCVTWTCQTGQCAAIVNEDVVQSAPIQGGEDLHPACRMRECNTRTGQVVYVVDQRQVDEPCDDGNTCTFNDVCHLYGQCGGTDLAHGSPCDDANSCTVGDYCHDGACAPGKDYLALANQEADPLNPDPDDVHRDPAGIIAGLIECRQYYCDLVRGVIIINVADGMVCDDENPCTASSSCQNGECFGVRDATNDGNVCASSFNECEEGYCDKGVCINFQPVTDLRACTGFNPCKNYRCEDSGGNGVCMESTDVADGTNCGELSECQDLICQTGMCIPEDPAAQQGQPCGIGMDARCNGPTCDANAACVPNAVADGTACTLTDEDMPTHGLTANDRVCNRGECLGMIGGSVCMPLVDNEGGVCDNSNPCDGADWCSSGFCVEQFITDDVEDAEFDNLAPTGGAASPCEVDGLIWTVGRCRYSGECIEISRIVDDSNECTAPEWNETTGLVDLVAKANGTACHLIAINPCVENHGVCLEGECHVTPMPDGTACDVVDLELPAVDDLPADHTLNCYREACVAGQCTINTSLQDGDACDDGDTTCSEPGACSAGLCQESLIARGYGETCTPRQDAGIVDINGNPINGIDLGCWTTFECSETGTCNVAVVKAPDTTACDVNGDNDTCDGWCTEGVCEMHNWVVAPNLSCNDDNVCTIDRCDGSGNCEQASVSGTVVGCIGVSPTNQCANLECVSGQCIAVNDPNNPCSDDNTCTNLDQCISGVCIGTGDPFVNNLPCGDAEDFDTDDDCLRAECADGVCVPNAGYETVPVGRCGPENVCAVRGTCNPAGDCVLGVALPDGTNCDTNDIPCDEGCLDIDGVEGDALAACLPYANFMGLLTSSQMAANGSPFDANGFEEIACRALHDLTFDPESGSGGNDCTRYVCYFGACHPWNDALPGDAGLFANPTEGMSCGGAGVCTQRGTCVNNACDSYHHLPDGTTCAEQRCSETDNNIYQPICEAGACTSEGTLVDSCSKGIATCQAVDCVGEDCSRYCIPSNFDYVNAFEDIAGTGIPRMQQMASPYDTSVKCGDFIGVGPATEMERMACDDGSVMVDLWADMGFANPDFMGNPEGSWFYNRRYRYISISANGTVLFHKDHPGALAQEEHTLFITANVGGDTFDPDADDQAGDPVNDGSNAAQMRVFHDDLTFISDITEAVPANPAIPYGNFTRFGEVYTEHMPGPDGFFEDGMMGNFDDYLIIQWDRAAFYGCALDGAMRSVMTVQMKWWPATGQIVFAYPDETNEDGVLLGPWCLPGRINGSDACIGLYDEGLDPQDEVGARGWLIVNDSGPDTDTFDGYYLFWPTDRPITHYAWRGVEWFEDLTVYEPDSGGTRGEKLIEISNCDDCCQRIDLDEVIFIDGSPRSFMNVCSDGYVHFMDYQSGGDASINAGPATMRDPALPVLHAAPFWSDLRLEANQRSSVYWLDDDSTGSRRIIVQWDKVDYNYLIVPFGLPMNEQERGEFMCSNNSFDDDGDGLDDCDDDSCACAQVCGGPGCGLTFQAIIHVGLGMIEFRYQNPMAEFWHAYGSTQVGPGMSGIAIGFQQGGGWGIDLMDEIPGTIPADVDEIIPSEQLNVILPQNAFLWPYGE